MNIKNRELLFSLIGSAISGKAVSSEYTGEFSSDVAKDIISVAKNHDIVQLLSAAIQKNPFVCKDNEIYSYLQKQTFQVVFRYEQLNYELTNLCNTLEECGIDFMPLKGSVIRKHYPEPWMRTSCDIDILVKQEDLEKAAGYLCEKLNYEKHSTGSHDISFFSQSKIHIELHYTLIEDGLINDSAKVLEDVWNTATLKDGFKHYYVMPDEMFYFYHIAHMAKHFENGGCGIRPFVDLYLLDKNINTEKCDSLLEKGGLLKFTKCARKLCKVWFEGEKTNTTCELMSEFVIKGGVYGSESNRISLQQQQRGGRLRYAISRIFLPYDVIKFYFPVLQKHKWLLPFIQVRRWGGLVFRGRMGTSVGELKYNSQISSEDAREMKRFLDSIGL